MRGGKKESREKEPELSEKNGWDKGRERGGEGEMKRIGGKMRGG